VFGGAREIAPVAIKCAQVIVRLYVCGLDLQNLLKFSDSLLKSSALGEHTPKVIARADETRIERDGGLELFESLVGAFHLIEDDAEEIVREGGARRGLHGGTRCALGFVKRI
jgi:hypothetical protein